MAYLPPCQLLARLRASARLAVLVLAVFVLKIGAAAACAKHDFADLGFPAGADQKISQAVDPGYDEGDQGPTVPGHPGSCSHCGCHHAAALIPEVFATLAAIPHAAILFRSGLPPSASQRLELRPPIV